MHKFLAALVGSAAIAAAACSQPSDKMEPGATMGAAAGTLAEPNIGEIRSAIDAANQKMQAAMLAGDITAAIDNYADDAVMMMPTMPMWNGRLAIEGGMKEMLAAMKIDDATFNTLDVLASGDLAVETGTFAFTTTMKGAKPATDKGKYLTVWKRQSDGSWKIIRDINNSDGVPPAKAK